MIFSCFNDFTVTWGLKNTLRRQQWRILVNKRKFELVDCGDDRFVLNHEGYDSCKVCAQINIMTLQFEENLGPTMCQQLR